MHLAQVYAVNGFSLAEMSPPSSPRLPSLLILFHAVYLSDYSENHEPDMLILWTLWNPEYRRFDLFKPSENFKLTNQYGTTMASLKFPKCSISLFCGKSAFSRPLPIESDLLRILSSN